MDRAFRAPDDAFKFGPADLRLLPIFHYGRSGSTVLTNLLGKQPHIHSLGEIFTPNCFLSESLEGGWWEAQRNSWPVPWEQSRHAARATALLRKVVRTSLASMGSKRDVVFEVKFHSFVGSATPVAFETFVRHLKSLGVDTVVVLHRNNLLRRLVSVLISNLTNVWHVQEGDVVPRPKLVLNVDSVLDPDFVLDARPLLELLEITVAAIRDMDLMLREHFHVFTLTYETDLESAPNLGAEAVATRILGRSYIPATPDWVRQNGTSLKTIVSNYDEVRQALRGSPFAEMAA